MNIEQDIVSWDGKSSADITQIFNSHEHNDTFVIQVLDVLKKESTQKGASWLLKHHFEKGGVLGANDGSKICRMLSQMSFWESKLHILQCMPYMRIAAADKTKVEMFLRKCLVDNNKMVRAWAYNGFYEISTQYPEYISETKQFFDLAMNDEAPSVKARIRNILKKGF